MQRTVAIDETLITNDNGTQVWLMGVKDITTKNVRLDILPNISSANIKIFVKNHIQPGSHITHEGWKSNNFLDSYWTYESHNHGHGDFGYDLNSKSHIESY